MCGRFALKAAKGELIDYLNLAACDDSLISHFSKTNVS